MKLWKFAFIIILSGMTVLAQERRGETNDARGSRDLGESRSAPVNTPAPTTSSSGNNGGTSNNGNSGSPGYNGFNNYYYNDYYRMQELMWYLQTRGYWDHDFAGRYQRREPLLTDQAVQVGLHTPLVNAGSLLAAAVELRDLVNRLDQDPSVKPTLQESVTRISRLIKEIRNDPMLSYMDVRQADSDSHIASNQDLKSLADQLVKSLSLIHI